MNYKVKVLGTDDSSVGKSTWLKTQWLELKLSDPTMEGNKQSPKYISDLNMHTVIGASIYNHTCFHTHNKNNNKKK